MSVSEGLYQRDKVRVGKVSLPTKIYQAVGALPEALKNFAFSTFLLPIIVDAFGVRSALNACVAVLAVGAMVCQRWAPETRHVPLASLDQPGGPPEPGGPSA